MTTRVAGDEFVVQRRKTLEAGKALLLAKSAFAHEIIHLRHLIQPCDDETGFRLLDKFREQCQVYVFDYKRGSDPGIKHAANELYRLIAVDRADYTNEQMDGFVKWYEKLKNRIGRAIGDLFDFHGDGFGDLCDSLPLAGRAIVERCLATIKKPNRSGFLEEEEIESFVKESLGPVWAKFICHGENYVSSTLEGQMRKWMLSNLLRSEEWFSDEEKEAARYADFLDD